MTATNLTVEHLREVLQYDPKSGLFVWRMGKRRGKVAGYTAPRGYIYIRIDEISHLAHRLAWLYVNGVWPTHQIDHIDTTKGNNAIANLRDVTGSINQQNRRRAQISNRSGLLGVKQERGFFRSYIKVGKRRLYLGSFRTAAEAHAAYTEAKRRLHPGNTL